VPLLDFEYDSAFYLCMFSWPLTAVYKKAGRDEENKRENVVTITQIFPFF
jgi:hypothetical protein